MEDDPDILYIAGWAIRTYGSEAVPIMERRAKTLRNARERQDAELWERVADAAWEMLDNHTDGSVH
jgi:hypothetical protein